MRSPYPRFAALCCACVIGLACAGTSEAGKQTDPAAGNQTAPAYTIETLTLTPQPVLVIRAQAAPEELEATMNALMVRLIAYAMMRRIDLAGPPLARYHTRTDERVDFEAAIPTVKPLDGDPERGITSAALPAGPAIATVHRGAYESLPAAHAALARWARAHGRKPAGGAWEVFLTNPIQERDVSRWRTKVFLPLAK